MTLLYQSLRQRADHRSGPVIDRARLLQRPRPLDEVTLNKVHTQFAQAVKTGLILDLLCDDLEAVVGRGIVAGRQSNYVSQESFYPPLVVANTIL